MSFALSVAFVLAAHAGGDGMFNVQASDQRIERIQYADNKVVKIGGIINQPFLIEFQNDELIEDVAGGSIAGWDVHKKAYRLYIRPLDSAKRTTLIVTTRKHSYVFDLEVAKDIPANYSRRPSKIVFDYPPPPVLPPASLVPIKPVAAQPDDAVKIEPSIYRNENYSMQIVAEFANIRPIEVHDDGRFTWFKFPSAAEIPAIYKSELHAKEEILVGSHMEGDYVVMHAISPLWNLRLAQSMIGVFNDSYGGQGIGPNNGTTVFGLVREGKK